MTFETQLREMVTAIVREEVQRALSAATAPDEYLSTVAAAKLADVAPGTIRRWIREGRLEPHHAGREVRVRRADLERMLRHEPRDDDKITPEQLAARDFG